MDPYPTPSDPTPIPLPVKPGYKTTEFWLALFAKLLGGAFAAGLIADGTPLARIAGLAAVVLTSLGYTVSRGMTKAAAALLVISLAASTQLTACAATTATVKKEAATLEGCSAADAALIVTASAQIVADVKSPSVNAAIDVIGQLATIHAAWARCKGVAPPTVPVAAASR